MTTTMYGIRNCDTVKKARGWLDANGVAYAFQDYKSAGVDRATLVRWVDRLGWESLLNRSGTTFRTLPDADKVDLDRDKAVSIMMRHPSAIRRPVVESGETLLVGFAPERYGALTPGAIEGSVSMPTATWNDTIIATSDDIVTVENNPYLTADSIDPALIEDSTTTSICPWKGTAHYKTIVVDGKRNVDAAWYYPDPKPAAADIKGRFAFWKGVKVE